MQTRAVILALAAFIGGVEVAAARATLVGPQSATFSVGYADIAERYEIYSDNGRVYVSYHIDGGRSAFGFTATRVWDASNGGCGDLINNVPIGPPHGGADHVLRVGACSTLSANGAVRVSMKHYVRDILGPGAVGDHEDVYPIVFPDSAYTTDAVEPPTVAPQLPAPPPAAVITASVVTVQIPGAPAIADFTTLTAQSAYDGVIDLGDGYSLRHVNDWYGGANNRRFQFDVFGPRGLISPGAYEGADASAWQSRISMLRVGDRTLYFAFSDWRNEHAALHYAWR